MARPTRAAILATGVLAVLTLAACSNDDAGVTDGMDHGTGQSTSAESSDSAADFNDADVMFAQMLIPHHQQTIEMSDILLANEGAMPEVADLAQQIQDAQGSEVKTLTSWLTEWGADAAGDQDMDHGDMGTDSEMMSEEDLADLEATSGHVASRIFLEQMIMHHEGAIAIAQDQVSNGQNPAAIALAEDIIATREAEITTMGSILGTLSDMGH